MRAVETQPTVSIIMAVRNGAPHVTEAIASIRRQTWTDWELIVVNDGSVDDSGRLAEMAAAADKRVRVLHQEASGLVEALNHGAAAARGELLARIDADDRAHPVRLERQVSFLRHHPEVGVLGTAVRRFGTGRGVWRRPVTDPEIRSLLVFEAPFAHPTVMFRRALVGAVGGEWYRTEFRAAEDIDLWERLASHTAFANLAEPLLDYRVHERQVTRTAAAEMAANGAKVRRRVLQSLELDPTDAEVARHEAIVWLRAGTLAELQASAAWFERLANARLESARFEPVAWHRALARRWYDWCTVHSSQGLPVWRTYRCSPLAHGDGATTARRAAFWFRCWRGGGA